MRWRLIIEKFGPELKYKRCKQRRSWRDNQDILNISEIYGYNDKDLPDSVYPIRYQDIAKAQKTDAKLKQKKSHIKTIPSTLFVGAIKITV